jgi:SAM-dependent methyltransferase
MADRYAAAVRQDPYRDPDLVTLYDIDNPDGRDHQFYRHLADSVQARSIIDLGCGTGLLTRSLASPERTVIGVDPSETMLDYARRQPGAENIHWINGDATALPQNGDADLVLCTGNAIQEIGPEDLPVTFARVAGALSHRGLMSFESRNPAFREWERWTPEATAGERQTSFGHLREWLEVTEVDGDRRVVFDAHNIVDDGDDRIFTSILHFRTAREFTELLSAAGFDPIEITGGWDGRPVTDTSPILVVRAVRG